MDLAERIYQLSFDHKDKDGLADHTIPYFLLTRWAPGDWLHTWDFIDYATFMGGLI